MNARLHSLALLAGLALLTGGCRGPSERGNRFDPYAPEAETSFQATTAGSAPDPALLQPPSSPYTLGPGDVVDIELLGSGEGPRRVFVGPDGKIYFHLLPGLNVWGLTLAETRARLEEGLARFLQHPSVSLTLREVHSRRVWVLGRVNTPGLYELGQPMTVLEAVSKAGGLFTSRMSGSTEELADLHHSFLIRNGSLLPVNFHRLIREGNTAHNVYLESGDLLYLPSALGSQVYVLGAVFQPRAVAFKDQVTLLTALAHGRGFVAGARPGEVAIVRGSLHEPAIAVVNAQDILNGRRPDILLRPGDIVYVPSEPPLSLASYARLVVQTFARTLAANEGARAGGTDAPVDVNIGVSP